MSEQLTFDNATARAAADDGMRRAIEHAESECENWGELAYLFLEQFCRRNLSFISEDVSGASKTWGMVQPPTDRAWGQVYRRAQKAGVIEMDGTGRSRRRHASLCPRWRSKIYCVPA